MVNFLTAFETSETIGDITNILRYARLTETIDTFVWPVLFLNPRILGINGADDCIASCSHLYEEIEFVKITDPELINRAVTSTRPSITCSFAEMRPTAESLINIITKCQVTRLVLNDSMPSVIVQMYPSLKGSSVKTLDLERTSIDYDGCAAIVGILNMNQINSLNVSQNVIGFQSLTSVCHAVESSHLLKLHIRRCNIDFQGFNSVVRMLSNSKLEYLDISSNRIDFEENTSISLMDSKLRFLRMGFCQISSQSCKSLSQNLSQSSLRELYLNNNLIFNDGFIALCSALVGSQVQHLDVSYNVITAEGCAAFAQIMSKTRINEFNISANRIGNEGCIEISKYLVNSSLKAIHLHRCEIDDDGIKHLFSAPGFATIKTLSISDNIFGIAALIHICLSMPNIKLLELNARCQIHDNTLRDNLKGLHRIAEHMAPKSLVFDW
jgi:Ran GTPase-activating protein (RanGAP) involved in mRNA processing and transport